MEHIPKPNAKEIKQFKKLYLQKFGVDLTDEEATDAATRLLQVFVLTSPKVYEHFNGSPNELDKTGELERPPRTPNTPKPSVDGVTRRSRHHS